MRVLADACTFCGFSLVYCHCVKYIDNLPCCPHCRGVTTHRPAPTTARTPSKTKPV